VEEDPNTAMLFAYDAFGRLAEARDQALDKSVRYGYDLRSLRSKMEVVDYAGSTNGVVFMSVVYTYRSSG
jgi:YD repeat-containing protein